jgi:VanZ family protein
MGSRMLRAACSVVLVAGVGVVLCWPRRVDGGLRDAIYAVVSPRNAYPAYLQADLIANVVLFLPVGFLLTMLGGRWWAGLLGGAALSATAETVQLFLPHRVASLLDVATNSAGAALGMLAAVLLRVLVRFVRDQWARATAARRRHSSTSEPAPLVVE